MADYFQYTIPTDPVTGAPIIDAGSNQPQSPNNPLIDPVVQGLPLDNRLNSASGLLNQVLQSSLQNPDFPTKMSYVWNTFLEYVQNHPEIVALVGVSLFVIAMTTPKRRY